MFSVAMFNVNMLRVVVQNAMAPFLGVQVMLCDSKLTCLTMEKFFVSLTIAVRLGAYPYYASLSPCLASSKLTRGIIFTDANTIAYCANARITP